VAINGFGRIGRNFLRCWHGRDDSPLDVIAINDTGGVKQASHLLKYDSTLGTFDADVKPVGDDGISVDGKVIKVVSDRNPSNLPWGELGIDLVIEGTGVFVDREGAGKHIQAGAKKVLITAPGKGDIPTYVVGVNADHYNPDEPIISNASCTTNCLAPVAKVLQDLCGIERGYMTTIHSYTGDQPTLDTMHKDLYRARAASLSMIPTSTGAAKAVGLVLPQLKGKLDGSSIRVPTPNVSVVDLKFVPGRTITKDEINEALTAASQSDALRGVLAVSNDPLVSIDMNHIAASSTAALPQTQVIEGQLGRVLSWYDNEWGFSTRMSDTAIAMAKLI
jgi:glyceraldehyde-3-phosphate dehydrogenase (NADP+) (phosphorylating)